MWLNAASDRDDGDVLFGNRTEVPEGLALKGYLALFGSTALAWFTEPRVGCCALAAASLSILYSHPSTRWKAHPFLGPSVNAIGYGVLSPAAGWVLVGVPLGWRVVAVASLTMATALSVYFIAQVFQVDEDRRRGDRTLAATHGSQSVVVATRLCLAYAAGGAFVLCVIGGFPRVCVLAAPAWLSLDRWLLRECRRGTLDEVRVRGFVRRLFAFGLVLLTLATGDYVHDLRVGGFAAGQATALR
jgi:4-hydroxybenzoate polyprenyltransferase